MKVMAQVPVRRVVAVDNMTVMENVVATPTHPHSGVQLACCRVASSREHGSFNAKGEKGVAMIEHPSPMWCRRRKCGWRLQLRYLPEPSPAGTISCLDRVAFIDSVAFIDTPTLRRARLVNCSTL